MSDYRLLLEGVAGLYERHEAGRRQPFNVFSVLHRATDEVNLHSRFLHSLLDWKSPEARRENLKDFLQHVAEKQFEEKGAKVERERDDIDILITNNDAKQAVVIENKIESGDPPKQLQRYYKRLKSKGYSDIHLLYLTLHGDEPSEDSAGDLDYKTISYKDDLPPWLERCQQRAYDEPALRESVAQYLRLIRKLTGTDFTGEYMNELKKLLLRDNNLVLACDLIKAKTEVHIDLLQKLWGEIESELRKMIPDLPDKANKDSDILPTGRIVSPDRTRDFVERQRNSMYHGLYYPFGNSGAASLGVEVEHTIFFGVRCLKNDYEEEYNKLKEALKDVIGGPPTDEWWPWYKYANEALNLKNPTRETLEMLSNEEKRTKYIAEIARGLAEIWNTVKAAGLAP